MDKRPTPAALLRFVLDRHELTQISLARDLDIARQTVGRWLAGVFPQDARAQVEERFDLTPGWFSLPWQNFAQVTVDLDYVGPDNGASREEIDRLTSSLREACSELCARLTEYQDSTRIDTDLDRLVRGVADFAQRIDGQGYICGPLGVLAAIKPSELGKYAPLYERLLLQVQALVHRAHRAR